MAISTRWPFSRLRQYRTFAPPHTVGYLMPFECSIDIDDEEDWQYAEWLAAKGAR